ncbi:transketolase [Chloroflexota bacterium]
MASQADYTELEKKTKWVRQEVLEMCVRAGEGRIASAFSCMELMVALFAGKILRFDTENLRWEDRDRFIMSKSPGVVGLYPILSDLGFFTPEELENYCLDCSLLGPYGGNVPGDIPGVEAAWGSLGHGLGVGAGLALAAIMDGKDYVTVVMLGDGECYEGAIWEAAMFASHHKLKNLVAIVDRNGKCTIGKTEEHLKLEPFESKWKAFGWDVITINGHSFNQIFEAFEGFRNRKLPSPLVIIADTVKGKGVTSLENNDMSHVVIPEGDELEKARKELRQ